MVDVHRRRGAKASDRARALEGMFGVDFSISDSELWALNRKGGTIVAASLQDKMAEEFRAASGASSVHSPEVQRMVASASSVLRGAKSEDEVRRKMASLAEEFGKVKRDGQKPQVQQVSFDEDAAKKMMVAFSSPDSPFFHMLKSLQNIDRKMKEPGPPPPSGGGQVFLGASPSAALTPEERRTTSVQ
jgi:hypothetical protein